LRKVLFASAAGVIALMLASTYQAAAITNGRPDGNGHFCAGANPNFNYRLDTPSARAFLSQFPT
jgi:hypothetical protein